MKTTFRKIAFAALSLMVAVAAGCAAHAGAGIG
jgi:hypothetical protein